MRYEISHDEFNIDFMRSHGYVRKKCKICGAYFWTNNPDVNVCGEPPCGQYTFLRKSLAKRKFSVRELRNCFLKFFEKYGHEIIKPYPVVSRWRDDLLVTIASIADFQPFVTSGVSEPPANPLVISQPCLRFDDIHNVGLTAGRHLTIFEMGGAHAFNRENKWIYWKNETIDYHHKFATEELGVPEDEIIYKEHFWIGGGNAGPDVEGIIGGLEVSTLVFMKYKVLEDGSLVETPILTVDTGYGIERWAWLSSATPTAFNIIYGELVDKVFKWAGLQVDNKLLYEDSFYSGSYSAESPSTINEVRMEIAKKLGLDPEEVNRKLKAVNELFALLDHSKAAIFLIKDGAMPSNVREGYLTRMLLRRVFRILSKYEMLDYLDDLVDEQIKLWRVDFKELLELEDVIHEVISLEYGKYLETIKRGEKIILKTLRRKGEVSLDDLILMYESHGLPPDYVSEVALKYNYKVEVPSNFHALIARRHSSLKKEVSEELKFNFKYETESVYYDEPYRKELISTVKWVGRNHVILDKTIFYPEGGGQLGDTGWIIRLVDNYRVRVIDTRVINGNIVHIIDGKCNLNPGDEVKLIIDWERRYSLMKTHTATHIVLSATRRVLGNHIWQTGAEKTPTYGRLDITHYKEISDEDVKKIEYLANEIVSKGINVDVSVLERGRAEKLFGPQIYQGGVVTGKYVRIVKIGDWDVEACGGLHVSNTREIQLIKIVKVEKIHEGVIRLIYKVGSNALREFQEDFLIVKKLSELLSTKKEEVFRRVKLLIDENNRLKKELSKIEEKLLEYESKSIYEAAEVVNGVKIICLEGRNVEEAIKFCEKMDKTYSDFILVYHIKEERGFNVLILVGREVRNKYPANKIGSLISKLAKGGGKGDKRYYRFGGPGKFNLEDFISMVKAYVRGNNPRNS